MKVAGRRAGAARIVIGGLKPVAAAWVGIIAHPHSLADYLRQALTSSEFIVLLVVLPNAVLLVIWCVLVGRGLLRFGNPEARSG